MCGLITSKQRRLDVAHTIAVNPLGCACYDGKNYIDSCNKTQQRGESKRV